MLCDVVKRVKPDEWLYRGPEGGYIHRMKIVINVDDVGLHPAVNRAVEILAKIGTVTSGSIVANGLVVPDAAALSGIGLGVHLDILRGRPVGHWQEVSSLVDENGMFFGSPGALFRRFAIGKVEYRHIEREWAKQIEKVIDLGIKPTHLSSHGQVHAWPALTRMVGELAVRYGIRWIRKPEECSEITRLDQSGLWAKFLNVCGLFSRKTAGVNWADMVWGMADAGNELLPERFVQYVKRFGNGVDGNEVIEICCRPGRMISGDPPIPMEYEPTRLSAIWRDEFRSLSELDWIRLIEDAGLEQTNFGNIQ